MFDAIRLYVEDLPSFNIREIAVALGLNCDLSNSVLYAGNDPDYGIKMYLDDSWLIKRLWRDGDVYSDYEEYTGINQNSYLRYRKSSNGVVFGIGDPDPVITNCVSTMKDENGTSKYGYIFLSSSSTGIHNLIEDGSYEYMTYELSSTSKYPPDFISAAPMVHTIGRCVYDHVFIPSVDTSAQAARDIMIGNKEYIRSTKYYDHGSGILFEL